jgi:hypothetical protein
MITIGVTAQPVVQAPVEVTRVVTQIATQIVVVTADEEGEGWVYRDWISIAPEDAARVQTYPDALPVIITKITQSRSNGYEYWGGR